MVKMIKLVSFILILLTLFSGNILLAGQDKGITENEQNLEIKKDLSQESGNKLSIEIMKKDVDFIVEWVKTHHPEIIKYGFSKEQKDTIDFVYKNINKSMSENEFFFMINRLFSMLNDGHCILHYYPLTNLYIDIPFAWIDEGIIITKNTDSFKIGDKIISLGNKTESELISLIKQQKSSENVYWLKNNAYEILRSRAYLEHFDLINADDSVSIKILRGDKILNFNEKFKNTGTTNIELPIITNSDEWIDWYIEKENNLGYFRFDQWPPRGEKYEELKKQLDSFFEMVFKNNIKNIAFDIRRNTGGNAPILDDILSYIKTDKIYSASYEEYKAFVNKKDRLFDGEVYFLTSNKSFSCSVYALTILKDNKIVKTIGEPTGQKPAFNFHGEGSDGKLPNTGWSFMMTSSLNTRPMDIQEDHSLYPDIVVNTTSYDILHSLDPQMHKLRQIANPSLNKNIVKISEIITQKGSFTIKNSNFFNIDMAGKTINLKFNNNEIKKEDIKIYSVEKGIKTPWNITLSENNAVVYIQDAVKGGRSYLITINAADNIEYNIELIFGSNLKILNNSYTKFGYMLFTFSDNMKEIVEDKIKIYDEKGKYLDISEASITQSISDTLLISLKNGFVSGKSYTLYIPEKSIKLENGFYNNEALYLDFTLK